jgi:hypothetical protein
MRLQHGCNGGGERHKPAGYEKLSWRQAHQQLVAADEAGWRTAHPYLWGAVSGNREIVHGLPGENLRLRSIFRSVRVLCEVGRHAGAERDRHGGS